MRYFFSFHRLVFLEIENISLILSHVSIPFKHFSRNQCVFLIHFLTRMPIIGYSRVWGNHWRMKRQEIKDRIMLKWKGSLHLSFFIFLEILPENHVFYRDDVPSFLSPFESRFSRRMVSEFSWNWTHCCRVDFA